MLKNVARSSNASTVVMLGKLNSDAPIPHTFYLIQELLGAIGGNHVPLVNSYATSDVPMAGVQVNATSRVNRVFEF